MKLFLYSLIFLCTARVFSQADSSSWNLRLSNCRMSNGYIFQKEHMYEGGLKITYIKDNGKYHVSENFALIIGGQITRYNKVTYLNPFVSLRYLKPMSDRVGGVFSVSYAFRKQLGIISNAITPEIGVNINHTITLSYGYNFFIDNKYDWASRSRLAIRFMLH